MSEYGAWKHANPELFHLTDDEIGKLLTENSDSIQDDYIKAEAWDKLIENLEGHDTTYARYILKKMDDFYTEVEKDYK